MFKKLLLLLFIFTISINSYSQANLGITKEMVMNKHPDNIFKFSQTYDGTPYMYSNFVSGKCYYYFGEDNLSFLCILIPKNTEMLKYLIELYNLNYVSVSKNCWCVELPNFSTLVIKLLYSKDIGNYYFTFQ